MHQIENRHELTRAITRAAQRISKEGFSGDRRKAVERELARSSMVVNHDNIAKAFTLAEKLTVAPKKTGLKAIFSWK